MISFSPWQKRGIEKQQKQNLKKKKKVTIIGYQPNCYFKYQYQPRISIMVLPCNLSLMLRKILTNEFCEPAANVIP